MFSGGCCLFKAKHPKKGKPELYRISKIYWSSAQLVIYQHQDLLEQRASESKTYWNSAQVKASPQQKPIGTARRTYWSSAQVSQKPIGTARRWAQTYWNSAQVILASY